MILNQPLSLLFIEPENFGKESRGDAQKYLWFKDLLSTSPTGTYNEKTNCFTLNAEYTGVHTCICGDKSTLFDILLPNRMVTNSLAYHYLVHHWDEVSTREYFKLEQLNAYVNMIVDKEPHYMDIFNINFALPCL